MTTQQEGEEARQRRKTWILENPNNVMLIVGAKSMNQVVELKAHVGIGWSAMGVESPVLLTDVGNVFDLVVEGIDARSVFAPHIAELSRGEVVTFQYGRKRATVGGAGTPLCEWAQRQIVGDLSPAELCRFQNELAQV